jgi:hypothetical protein
MPIRHLEGVDLDAWRAHGRLTCEDAHAVAARGVREIVEPFAARLLGAPRALTAGAARAHDAGVIEVWNNARVMRDDMDEAMRSVSASDKAVR